MLSKPPGSPRFRCCRFAEKPPSGVWKLRKRAAERLLKPCTTPGGAQRTRTGAEDVLLVVEQEGELALEDVERVRMLAVVVGLGARSGIREERLGQTELGQGRPEDDPAAEERLAAAGVLDDA